MHGVQTALVDSVQSPDIWLTLGQPSAFPIMAAQFMGLAHVGVSQMLVFRLETADANGICRTSDTPASKRRALQLQIAVPEVQHHVQRRICGCGRL
jgi:hypothetical protein